MKELIKAVEKLFKIMKENQEEREQKKEEISTNLNNLLEDFKAVWKLDDSDDWIKSVKKDFENIKKLL